MVLLFRRNSLFLSGTYKLQNRPVLVHRTALHGFSLAGCPDKYAQERGGWSSDRVMKNVYTHTFSEEREKVDETIDNYFDSLLDGSASEKEKSAIEIINALRKADPNGWYKTLLNMQHEMQHKN